MLPTSKRPATSSFSVETLESRQLFSGDGLVGNYFNSITPGSQSAAVTRVDPSINFTWPDAPAKHVRADEFSARWTGFIQAETTGYTTLYTSSDDGVRLSINGKLLIDNWTEHALTGNKATVFMQAGYKYAITLDYFDAHGSGTIDLMWSNALHGKQLIPQANLYTADTQPPTVPSALSGTCTDTTVQLTWTASTDDVGVAKYDVYRDGNKIGTVKPNHHDTLTFRDSGLTASTSHSYIVKAHDAAGHCATSALLAICTAPPAADGVVVPENVRMPYDLRTTTVVQDSSLAYHVCLAWSAPVNVTGLVGFDIYRNGANRPAGLVQTVGPTTTTFTDSNLFHDTDYTYFVVARFADGSISNASTPLLVTMPGSPDDTEARGFTADFFNGTTPIGTQADELTWQTLAYDWGNGAPTPNVSSNVFSVNVHGMLMLPYSAKGTTLYFLSEGGLTVTATGATNSINHADQHAETIDTIFIPAGLDRVYLSIQYSSDGTQPDAELKLDWSTQLMDVARVPYAMVLA